MLVVMAMFGATLWLLYLQAFILHAFCPFCLLSAALTYLTRRHRRRYAFF
jgi:uncharacterized membrane protein